MKNMEKLEKQRKENKELAKGKSSKECSFAERVEVYRATVMNAETPEERFERIRAFRCGW